MSLGLRLRHHAIIEVGVIGKFDVADDSCCLVEEGGGLAEERRRGGGGDDEELDGDNNISDAPDGGLDGEESEQKDGNEARLI